MYIWDATTLDPIAITIFGVPVYWYGLAYAVSLLIVFHITPKLATKYGNDTPPYIIDSYFFYGMASIVVGGRLGYVLLYRSSYFLEHPWEIFNTMDGGMSFHGALVVTILVGYMYVRIKKVCPYAFADVFAVTVPIGLVFGRVANFVNGELYGRPTDGSWGVLFADGIPRHPSQLYEAGLEGGLLFVILIYMVTRLNAFAYKGLCIGVFLMGYGIIRIFIEEIRHQDITLAMPHDISLAQWYSVPMVIIGASLIHRAVRGRV